MKETTLNRAFEAPPSELFERATEDDNLESKLLILTKKQDVDISEWTKQDNHATRVIGYIIPAAHCPSLALLSKSADLTVSKFQDVYLNEEKTEFTIDYKIFYAQTQAVGNIRVELKLVDSATTQCRVTIKNTCKNLLLRDKLEQVMEDETTKEMNLWMDLLWERHMAHKAMLTHKPPEPEVEAIPVAPTPINNASYPVLRSISPKPYSWASQELQELGEMEEMKVLSSGLSNVNDELDSLRKMVEAYYVRLCSLESHLTSQSQNSMIPSTSSSSTNAANAAKESPSLGAGSTNDSSSRATESSQTPNFQSSFNSLEELDSRQRVLRSQLTAQIQDVEKSILKQQQASHQIKVLETRWEGMVDMMMKQLQEIDTLRYGLLGGLRSSLSLLCFIIIWPLIVRYIWITVGKRWTYRIMSIIWPLASRKTVQQAAKPQLVAAVASATFSPTSSALSSLTRIASAETPIAPETGISLTRIISSAFRSVRNASPPR